MNGRAAGYFGDGVPLGFVPEDPQTIRKRLAHGDLLLAEPDRSVAGPEFVMSMAVQDFQGEIAAVGFSQGDLDELIGALVAISQRAKPPGDPV